MQLKTLHIYHNDYGDDKGKYSVSITFQHERNETKLVLPSDVGNALIAVVSDHILKASQETANRLHNSIASSILAPPLEVKQLE